MTTLRETERTYEPSDGGGFPRLAGLPGIDSVVGPAEVELENAYFDTADLRLAAAGVTLRHRRGGGETGWQLKLPAGADSRDEVRVADRRDQRRRPPAELATLVRAFTRGAALVQVALMTTTRRRWTLVDASGAQVAEVVDDLVRGHRTGSDTTAVTWREIEVELAEGGEPVLLDRVERRFARAGLRRSKTAVKLARVLGDRWPAATVPRIGKRSTVGDVVLAALREHHDALRHQDPQVRLHTPDAVHQMRVAARRLRSILQAFGRVVDRERTRSVTDELKWLGEALGPARDLEVLHGRLGDAVAELPAELVLGPVAAELTRTFGPREAEAGDAAIAALDTDRYLALLKVLDRLLADPPVTARARRPARKELPRQLARSHRRLTRRLRTAAVAPAGITDRETALHEARKAAKRMRYATTAARPALGKPAKRLARRVKALQTVLGDHHDTVVARPAIRELAVKAHGDGGNGFTYGLLHEREAQVALAGEREVPGLWKRVGPAARKVLG